MQERWSRDGEERRSKWRVEEGKKDAGKCTDDLALLISIWASQQEGAAAGDLKTGSGRFVRPAALKKNKC